MTTGRHRSPNNADDAAGLIDALDLAPAVVFGLSSGAIFTVELLLRQPNRVRAAFVHEPPYIAASSDPERVATGFQVLAEQGMEQGGPPAALELFLRLVCGDEVYDSFDRGLLERVLDNGEVFFTVEMPAQGDYLPDEDALRGVNTPCVVTAGTLNADAASPLHWNYEASQWLADALGARFAELPGGHVPSLTHPDAFIAFMREELDNLR